MNGNCAFKDDMLKILDSIENADMLVLATPVYYFAMTAPLKATLDRFYSRTMRISSKHLKIALITTCWNTDESTVRSVIEHYRKYTDYMHFENVGMIVGKGCGAVSMMPKLFLDEAYSLGRNL